jgi:hypothetical protein
MSNAAPVPYQPSVENYGIRSLTAADIRAQVNLIKDVMIEVMQEGTHYGKIPGTNGKSLWKAGAEKLMATFRLAAKPRVEDLSHDGEIHYRVFVGLECGGAFVGEGVGECSSLEEKYRWRASVHQKEWDATPENRRRIKYSRDGGETKQVRTNPADVSNTILKMAKKRAQVDAVITATAASDIFTQDIEDLPEEIVAEIAGKPRGEGKHAATVAQPIDSEQRNALIKTLRDVATMGTPKLKAEWERIGKEGRTMVGATEWDAIKKIAADADIQDAEFSEGESDAPAE